MSSVESSLGSALHTAQDALVTVVDSLQLRNDAPFSPDVPKDLLASMPDLTGRLLLTFPWSKSRPVDPSQHIVWIFDNTAYRVQPCASSSNHLHYLSNCFQKPGRQGQQAQRRPQTRRRPQQTSTSTFLGS